MSQSVRSRSTLALSQKVRGIFKRLLISNPASVARDLEVEHQNESNGPPRLTKTTFTSIRARLPRKSWMWQCPPSTHTSKMLEKKVSCQRHHQARRRSEHHESRS